MIFAIVLMFYTVIVIYNPPRGLFFLKRGKHHGHPFSLKLGHTLRPSVILQLHGETQKLFLTLIGELD